MKRTLLFFGVSFFSFFILAAATGAAEDDVACTVQVQNIACSVSDGDVTYGILGTSATAHTAAGGNGETQTLTNDGNDNCDFDIKGVSTTGTGGSWTLVAAVGALNEYRHDYCISDCDGTPTWVYLTTSYVEFSSDKAPLATQDFDLKIWTPTSTNDYDSQSATVWTQCSVVD